MEEIKHIPFNEEAEESILGAVFLKPDSITRIVDMLQSEDFYKPLHTIIYNSMVNCYSKNQIIDPVIVINDLKKLGKLETIGGEETIFQFMNIVPTAANIENYARIVKEKSILRKLIEVGTIITEIAYDDHDEVEQILDKAENLIFKIAQSKENKEVVHVRELIDKELERLETVYQTKGDVVGIGSGFKDFDELTSGFAPSNLVIIAARPAMGKTTFALNIALNAAMHQKKSVLVFSLEMSNSEIFQRLISSESKVELKKLKTGFLNPEEWSKVGISTGRLAESPIYIGDVPNVTVMEIRTICRRLKAENKLDMVLIDYLQLVHGGKKRSENRQQEISEITRGLKLLARELEVPVVVLSQLSRAPEMRSNKRPMLSDLRESGAIEQDADIVAFLYRDDYYEENSDKQGLCEIIVAKQRNGATGTIFLKFFGEITSFANFTSRNF